MVVVACACGLVSQCVLYFSKLPVGPGFQSRSHRVIRFEITSVHASTLISQTEFDDVLYNNL